VAVRAGDAIVGIDGLVPRDVIDLQMELGAARRVTVRRADGTLVELEGGGLSAEGLGLEEAFPGGIRECNNHCEFCFIRGLPGGLRPSLYVFDDDYRYSFLFGTFLTLTNLTEADWARIGYQRLSPLNVSVHATDPAVRRRLLNNRHAEPILPQLERLAQLGVRVNTQVVLCAGINDGACLEQTIHELANLYPGVQSLSVVPVGPTRYSRWKTIRRPTREEASQALEACERWQADLRRRLGRGFVYGSDELYLLAGRTELPPAEAYDGYPVLSNGVGLLRSMVDEWERLLRRQRTVPEPRRVVFLAGRLAAPALEQMADRWSAQAGWRPRVQVVDNALFGEQVSVSGLLSGADLVRELHKLPAEVEDVVLPRSAFAFDGQTTLDGLSAQAVGAAHRGRVHLASTPAELLAILREGVGQHRGHGGGQTDQNQTAQGEHRSGPLPMRRARASEPKPRGGERHSAPRC
jgi:putative radical SAM enzyme (TIGR03279 family)